MMVTYLTKDLAKAMRTPCPICGTTFNESQLAITSKPVHLNCYFRYDQESA